MRIRYYKPSPFLSQFIKYYWSLETDDSDGEISERVVPTVNIELMFHSKNSFIMKHPDDAITKQPRHFISGISSSYADVSTCGDAGMIAATFFPAGACNFFNLPMNTLADRKISLDDICSSEYRIFADRFNDENSPDGRIKIIEKFLLKRFQPVDTYNSTLLSSAISLINIAKGQINSSFLSEKLSVSSRSLERKFSTFLGKSPKQFSKIVRFQHVLNSFSNASKINLTYLAFEHGYFDQPHFINDFKRFSGYSPREFFTSHFCASDCLI